MPFCGTTPLKFHRITRPLRTGLHTTAGAPVAMREGGLSAPHRPLGHSPRGYFDQERTDYRGAA